MMSVIEPIQIGYGAVVSSCDNTVETVIYLQV
jgi:hypothetical protein